MLFRTISTACLMLCLSAIGTACDDKKPEAKADAKAKAEEKKAEAKVEEAKVEEAKADAKAEEAKAEEAKAEEAKAVDAKAEDAKAADAKAEEAKAEDAKAVEAKVEEKKAEDKKPAADPKKPAAEEPKADPGPSADGKGLYDKKCKNCHNGNGDGKTKIGAENDIEDWTVAGWKTKWTQQKIEDIVRDGKAGSKMKPFKDKLTADEIVAVSKYARSLGK